MAYCPRTRYEVEALLAQAQAAAGRIIKAAQDVFWGGYSGNFADPDGHLGGSPGIPTGAWTTRGSINMTKP